MFTIDSGAATEPNITVFAATDASLTTAAGGTLVVMTTSGTSNVTVAGQTLMVPAPAANGLVYEIPDLFEAPR